MAMAMAWVCGLEGWAGRSLESLGAVIQSAVLRRLQRSWRWVRCWWLSGVWCLGSGVWGESGVWCLVYSVWCLVRVW